jgi:hypothetical protein
MIRVAVVVVVLLGAAFAYHEMTNRSSHDQAVSSLKRQLGASGQGDPASVSCKSKPSPIPAGYAAYGNLTMFDCSFDTSTGAVVDICMLHGGKLSQVSSGWANTGEEGTCAAAGKMQATLASGGIPTLPIN